MRCALCGEEHSLDEIEPAFARPDVYAALSPEEQASRAKASDDLCMIHSEESGPSRYFVRATMAFVVAGRDEPVRWGLWAEIAESDYRDVIALWSDPEQGAHPPIAATLANQIPEYEPAVGMALELRLVDEDTRPELRPSAGVEHRFAEEFTNGVSEAAAIEWLHSVL